MSMMGGGSEYSAVASVMLDPAQFLAAVEQINKSVEELSANMTRMSTQMTAAVSTGMSRASSAVNTHTQRQTVLNSIYNTNSQVMQKRYSRSLQDLSTGLQKMGVEMQKVAVINKGLINNIDQTNAAWLRSKVTMDMVSRYADSMSTRLLNVGKNVAWTGRQLTVGLTTVIGGAAAYSIAQFAKFDQAVKQTQALVGQQFMPQLEASARQLSNQWGVSFADMVNSLGALQKALQTTPEQTQQLGQLAAQINAIGNINNMTTATNLVRNIFNFTGGDMQASITAVQQLGTISQQTALNLSDFVNVLPQALPLFKTFNISLADGASIMAAFKQAGLDSSTGLNALRMTLTRITAATSGSSTTLKTLRTQVDQINQTLGPNGPKISFFDQAGNLNAMGGLESMAAVWGKINDKQKAALLQLIGMRGGATAMVPLLNAIGIYTGTVASNTKQAAMAGNDFAKSQTIARENASQLAANWNTTVKQYLATPQQQFQALKTQLNNLAISIGQTLFPYALKLLGYAQQFVAWINQLSPSTKKWIIDIGLVAAAMGPVVYMMGQMITMSGVIAKTFTKPLSIAFGLISRQVQLGAPSGMMGLTQMELAQQLADRRNEVELGKRSATQYRQDQQNFLQYGMGRMSEDEFVKKWQDSVVGDQEAARIQEQAAKTQLLASEKAEKRAAKEQTKMAAAEAKGGTTLTSAAATTLTTDDVKNVAEAVVASDATIATTGISPERAAILSQQMGALNKLRGRPSGSLVGMYGSNTAAMMQGVSGQYEAMATAMGLPVAPFSRADKTLLMDAWKQTVGVGLDVDDPQDPNSILTRNRKKLADALETPGSAGATGDKLAAQERNVRWMYSTSNPSQKIKEIQQEQKNLTDLMDEMAQNPVLTSQELEVMRANARQQMGELNKQLQVLRDMRSGTIPDPALSQASKDIASQFGTALGRTSLGGQTATFEKGALIMGPNLQQAIPGLAENLGLNIGGQDASKLWMANFARMSRGSQGKLRQLLSSTNIPMPQDLANLMISKLFGGLSNSEVDIAIRQMMGPTMYEKLGTEFKASFAALANEVQSRIPELTPGSIVAQQAGIESQFAYARSQLALPSGVGSPQYFRDLGVAGYDPALGRTIPVAMGSQTSRATEALRASWGQLGSNFFPRIPGGAAEIAKPVEEAGAVAAPGFISKFIAGIKGRLGKGIADEVESGAKRPGILGGLKGLLGKGVKGAGMLSGMPGVQSMTAILPEASEGVGTLLISVAPLAIALAAIAAAVVLIFTHWKEVAKGIGSGLEDLKKAFNGLISAIVGPFEAVFKSVGDGFKGATDGGKAMKQAWKDIGEIINVISHAFAFLLNILKPVVGFIASQLATALKFIINTIELLLDLLTGKWGAAWNAAKQVIADMVKLIVTSLLQIPEAVLTIMELLAKLGSHLPFIGGKFRELAKDIQGWKNDLKDIPNDLSNAIGGAGDKASEAASKVTKTARQAALDWGKEFKTGLSDAMSQGLSGTQATNFAQTYLTDLQVIWKANLPGVTQNMAEGWAQKMAQGGMGADGAQKMAQVYSDAYNFAISQGFSHDDAAKDAAAVMGQQLDKAAQAGIDSQQLNPPQVDWSSFVSALQSELQNEVNKQKQDVLQAFDAYVKRRDQQITDEKNALNLKLKTEQDVNKQEEEIAKEAQERADMANTTAQFLADRQAAMAQGNFSDAMTAQLKYNDTISKQQFQLGRDQTAYKQSVFQEQIQDQQNALDIQKQQMDDSLTAQKQALSDMLDNMTKFLPQSSQDAAKLRESMVDQLKSFGGDEASVQQALSSMTGDAWDAAMKMAWQKVAEQNFWKSAADSTSAEFQQIGLGAAATFLAGLGKGVGNLDINVTLGGSPLLGKPSIGKVNPDNYPVPGHPQLHHGGGLVGVGFFGKRQSSSDVPAILQAGEFVIQKPVVDKLGAPLFSSINSGNFSGASSMVSKGLRGGTTNAAGSGGDVYIELAINGGFFGNTNDIQKLADMIELKLKPDLDRRRGLQQRSFSAYRT